MRTPLHSRFAAVLIALLLGCGGGQSAPPQPGEAPVAAGGLAEPAAPMTPTHDLQRGKAVFREHCLGCHGKGFFDAPRFGNAHDWRARLRQPQALLIKHAIEGHGRMPPKGGISTLSDTEVGDAVAYVVERSRAIILALEREQQRHKCQPREAPEECLGMDAEDVLTLQMLLLLGTPGRE